MQMKNDMENILDFVTLNILFFIFYVIGVIIVFIRFCKTLKLLIFSPIILIITLYLSLFSWFTILANYFIKKYYDI